MKMQWKIRRRALLVGALVILVILVGIHLASDIAIDGVHVRAGIDEDVTGQAPLPSNQDLRTTNAVPTAQLTATSILGHDTDIYLDGTAPILMN